VRVVGANLRVRPGLTLITPQKKQGDYDN